MTTRKLNKQIRAHGKVAGFPRLLGGRLCLEFVNTVEGRISVQPGEFLTDYFSLIRWAYHVGLISDEAREDLWEQAGQQTEQAAAQYREAVALREAIYHVFLALFQGECLPPEDLTVLQRSYVEGLRRAELQASESGVQWNWAATRDLAGVNWTVARSAVDLLTSPDARRVKQCPGCGDCGWLFFDTTKSGTRQWCSMEGCGSRAKMRRHYQRQHGSGAL
ncbi:ABATE domain-containing protein [Deinococcus sp. HMF7604]|uniref:CGNR zinc finger domain-containing protein n=1 Tax=Deinococcus betulae TaxID=2873312 RepID=UPI001CD0354E|nr:ABATE domain-containing protein [Deinococcus betulae]MBZ9752258.1 ABATE domain-containing protein [Deinococcus betulae]